MNAVQLLPKAVDKGVAFVPGAAFYADHADPRSLRLSFVTPSVPTRSSAVWPRWPPRCARTSR
jgi:DNA-binding transcriptional MocR family regulator